MRLGAGSQLFGVAVQPNGEVVAAGQSGGRVLVERFTTTGQPDGPVYSGPAGYARGVAIQPDGRIVVAGTSGGAMLVERLTPGLAPDPTFGPAPGGIVTVLGGQSAVANGVAIGPDGSIVAAGSVHPPDTQVGAVRLGPGGAVDWSEVLNFDHFSLASAVAVQPSDGKIVLVGRQRPGQNTNGVIARLNTNGGLDSTFAGGSGVRTYFFPGTGFTALNAVTLQTNGQIVAAGVAIAHPDALFVRFNSDGSLDPSFGAAGASSLPAGQNVQVLGDPIGAYGVGIAGGGRIVGAGMYQNTGVDIDAALWALSPTGAPESTFGSDGTVRGPTGGEEACALAVAPDGSLVAVGATAPVPDSNPCAANGAASGFVVRYGGYGPPPQPSSGGSTAPTVATGRASAITEVSASVSGTVNPNGLATARSFQYGTTTSYGATAAPGTAGSGTEPETVSAVLIGLRPGTVYHYRLVAQSSAGASFGADRTLMTRPRLSAGLRSLAASYIISTVSKRGLALRVSCDQACSIVGSLLISAATAKRLKLGRHQTAIGSGSTSLRAGGTAKLTLRLTRAAKKALGSLRGRLSLTLRVVDKPSGGGPQVALQKSFTLKP